MGFRSLLGQAAHLIAPFAENVQDLGGYHTSYSLTASRQSRLRHGYERIDHRIGDNKLAGRVCSEAGVSREADGCSPSLSTSRCQLPINGLIQKDHSVADRVIDIPFLNIDFASVVSGCKLEGSGSMHHHDPGLISHDSDNLFQRSLRVNQAE